MEYLQKSGAIIIMIMFIMGIWRQKMREKRRKNINRWRVMVQWTAFQKWPCHENRLMVATAAVSNARHAMYTHASFIID